MLKIFLIIILNIFIFANEAKASDSVNFERFMAEWNEQKELASKYLLKAEDEFKSGDELSACASQKEASDYGVAATQSLIYAMEVNGTTDSIENLEAGIQKWKEIGDVCGSIIN
tara:strand:+ start:189 stop:530 length:342 start_codon:yes stop_codon:yes gene_type:complete